MDVFRIELQSIFAGLTVNIVVLLGAYFGTSYRCEQGTALASARGAMLSYAKCFAAGILLGALFVGLMPTVRASVEAASGSHRENTGFPVAEALILTGFCVTVCIEQTLFPAKRTVPSLPSDSSGSVGGSPRGSSPSANLLPQGSDVNNLEHSSTDGLMEDTFFDHDIYTGSPDKASFMYSRPRMFYRMMMLIGCIAVHSVLDGITLGLQINVTTLLQMLFGVYVHGCVMLIALGLTLGGSDFPTFLAVRMGLSLAVMVPSGQVMGLMFGSEFGHWAMAGAQALTTGTFFHVLFVEILPTELGNSENRLPKVASLIAGFAFEAATAFASNHMLVHRTSE